jgi:hypothetical protein
MPAHWKEDEMEELDELREELAGVRAEAARLAEELADREARALEQAEGAAALRRDLETARGEAAAARAAATEETRRLAERYRDALLAAAPDVPPDLVRGESVEELDGSLAAARDVVTRVRERLEAQAAAQIGAGSPVRGTDAGALSPAEKIRLGVSERQ